MNQKYRGLYFLGATLGIGLLIIGGMKVFSAVEHNPGLTKAPIAHTTKGHQTLENKIKEFSKANFSPQQYNNLLIEINSGATQSLFNQDIKNMLTEQLNVKYKELAIARINLLFHSDPINLNEVNNLLSHVESTYGANTDFRALRSKLSGFHYYTKILPQKVNSFIDQGFAEFDANHYTTLTNELEKKAILDIQFRKKRIVLSTHSSEIYKLHNFYKGYLNWSFDMQVDSYKD